MSYTIKVVFDPDALPRSGINRLGGGYRADIYDKETGELVEQVGREYTKSAARSIAESWIKRRHERST